MALAASIASLVPVAAATVELSVDPARTTGEIDLGRYGLGQGGLSVEPMIETHTDQIAELRPQLIRLFVQEYFDLYPAHERYHWETLDRSIEAILATGAKPLLSLCFKPRGLYPRIDQDVVKPTDYTEWETLVSALVRHCNREKGYGIVYWEVGNEGDIGESGGCPYRFKPRDYTEYYTHTAAAILRADPAVKVGGPALAGHLSPLGDALLNHCAQGGAPLHFFSWHLYSNDPHRFRQTIRDIKQKLARYPQLAATETILDEWNIALVTKEPATGFQAAFVLENTLGFLEEGLSRAAYYHIRDYFVDRADFWWMSPNGLRFMADWWNVKPQNSGLFDNQGRRRPAYYVFQMLSRMQGRQLTVNGATNDVHALAARQPGGLTHILFWNFAPLGRGATQEVVLRLPAGQRGQFRLTQLNAASNRLEVVRAGAATELESEPIRLTLPPYGIGWLQLGDFKVRATWGHRSPSATPFTVRLVQGSPGVRAADVAGVHLEPGEGLREGAWQTRAGGGDVDGVEFTLVYPNPPPGPRRQEQSIWTELLRQSDPDTVQRLRHDPAFEPAPPRLTFQMDAAGTKGCTVSVDQLFEHRALWVPALDLFLSAGEPFVEFEEYQRALAPLRGNRISERVQREPEASYSQSCRLWPDLGNPTNNHPNHVVGVTWDSAIPKFGIDRLAGVRNDLGNPDHFGLNFDFTSAEWKGQHLTDGLPVVRTEFERDHARFEIEQFAYPLHGPPAERRGDISMVLLQKLVVTDLSGVGHNVPFKLRHNRELAQDGVKPLSATKLGPARWMLEDAQHRCLLAVEGEKAEIIATPSVEPIDAKQPAHRYQADTTVALTLEAGSRRELIIKLPSPLPRAFEQETLLRLDYAAARAATLRFWSDYLNRGALFRVRDPAVNELFRANLWHALCLPRRHGAGTNVALDLPYSNFAYGQTGAPWPVNQAVYVDYMLYDLRGYHDLAREELLAIYRHDQAPDGRVGGVANWGVYTPAMLYSVAQHYLLSHDRASFEVLLPPTQRALDWCLAQLKQAASRVPGPARGLILAPLNDLSHDAGAWAFNQAYFYAGLEAMARALGEIQHPRAADCRVAAQRLRVAIERAFGQAATQAPTVQLRDHTWSPYVPGDALRPRRLLEVWYPTDVDTGALHLARLNAIDPKGACSTALLNDHEDNLFPKGLGMANEPVYNPQATTYLLRDDPKLAIRAFYSMMACAFSQTVLEPVEHRWGWGQYFGPPSTDGAWFELYRRLLIQEADDGSLRLGMATPRAWLRDGAKIEVQRAPTYYGPIDFTVDSHALSGSIGATVRLTRPAQLAALVVRLRHPTAARLQRVEVNGQPWSEFDAAKEQVRISKPGDAEYRIRAFYRGGP